MTRSGKAHGWAAGFWLAAAVALAAPVELTLEEAIGQALAHNRDLARGALSVQGADWALRSARESVRGIVIAPEGAAARRSDGGDWGGGLRAQATTPLGTRLELAATGRQLEVNDSPDLRRAEVRAEISQPLFRNFGSLARNEPVEAAGDSLRAARRAWERDRSALVVRVAELYEGLIYLAHQIERDEAFASRLERLWALADAREQQGRTTRTEVMRLDLQRGEAAVRLEAARSHLDIQLQEFAYLLGLSLDTRLRLSPPPMLDVEDGDPGAALAVALAERPDYAQALDDIAAADRRRLLARRALLPDVRLTARHVTYGDGEEWREAGRLDQEDWFIGLAADMNLNPRAARFDEARAALDAESRRRAEEIVRHRLALEVHGALAAYRRTRAELGLAERNRELASRRAELARALFEAGRASADTVSDAESDYSRAELAELAARREASLSAYRLLHALGTLMPASPDAPADGKGES